MSQHAYPRRSSVIVIGLLLFAACAGPSPTAVPGTPVGATATPSATVTEQPAPIVTLDNNGQTLTLTVGERFLLMLGEGYDWTITIADETIVSRVVNVTVVRGAQGLYEAHKPGSTKLSAVGDPPCRKMQPPCAAPSQPFEILIVVE